MPSKGHRSAGGFEHDFEKFCVEHWGEKLYNIEKEAQGEGEGKRPDVVLRLKKPNPKRFYKVIVEVQRDIYKDNWLQKTMKKYENDCLIVIRVENFEKLPRDRARRLIAKLLDRDTKKPEENSSSDDEWMMYEGHRIKVKNLWKYKKREEYEKTSG